MHAQFTKAVESKQVAQQEAERARFVVMKADQVCACPAWHDCLLVSAASAAAHLLLVTDRHTMSEVRALLASHVYLQLYKLATQMGCPCMLSRQHAHCDGRCLMHVWTNCTQHH